MNRMQKTSPPTVRTFLEILMYFAVQGTVEAAERCESILEHMNNLSRKRPELQPDEICYSCAMSAWARTETPDCAERMWKLYEKMLADRENPDLSTCSQLLSVLSKSKRREYVMKADKILEKMENNSQTDIPNSIHYTDVMVRLTIDLYCANDSPFRVVSTPFVAQLVKSCLDFCRKDGPI